MSDIEITILVVVLAGLFVCTLITDNDDEEDDDER